MWCWVRQVLGVLADTPDRMEAKFTTEPPPSGRPLSKTLWVACNLVNLLPNLAEQGAGYAQAMVVRRGVTNADKWHWGLALTGPGAR